MSTAGDRGHPSEAQGHGWEGVGSQVGVGQSGDVHGYGMSEADATTFLGRVVLSEELC